MCSKFWHIILYHINLPYTSSFASTLTLAPKCPQYNTGVTIGYHYTSSESVQYWQVLLCGFRADPWLVIILLADCWHAVSHVMLHHWSFWPILDLTSYCITCAVHLFVVEPQFVALCKLSVCLEWQTANTLSVLAVWRHCREMIVECQETAVLWSSDVNVSKRCQAIQFTKNAHNGLENLETAMNKH